MSRSFSRRAWASALNWATRASAVGAVAGVVIADRSEQGPFAGLDPGGLGGGDAIAHDRDLRVRRAKASAIWPLRELHGLRDGAGDELRREHPRRARRRSRLLLPELAVHTQQLEQPCQFVTARAAEERARFTRAARLLLVGHHLDHEVRLPVVLRAVHPNAVVRPNHFVCPTRHRLRHARLQWTISKFAEVVRPQGFEPWTRGLKGRRSTA